MFFFRSSLSALPRAVSVATLARAATLTGPQPHMGDSAFSATSHASTALFTGTGVRLAPKRAPAKVTKPKTARTTKKIKSAVPSPRKSKATPVKTRTPRRTRQSTAATAKKHVPLASALAAANAATDSLAAFLPAIASTWLAAASSKMLQPHHVTPRSRKLAWWGCPSCQNQFTRRIDLHVAAGGECPKCHARPSSTAVAVRARKGQASSTTDTAAAAVSSPSVAASVVVSHRCRPDSGRATLAADNANRIKKSVADASYLRTVETRNLQPMLAKNYTTESKKISEDEVVWVSPKLDGIRCVVAYDRKNKALLFFSRAGTLFECCDDKIEPTLRPLFEANPYLVLDGELYNDSVNVNRVRTTKAATSSIAAEKASKLVSSSVTPSSSTPSSDDAIDFQALTSAIRTTRDRRTPEMAALQAKLQYHVFDVLHTASPDGKGSIALSSTPYSARYALLQSAFQKLAEVPPAKAPAGFDPQAIRLVSSLPFLKCEIEDALNSAIAYGYEGVMVRRDHVGRSSSVPKVHRRGGARSKATAGADTLAQRMSAHGLVKSTAAHVRRTPIDTLHASTDASGGYGFGQRSSTLLKYKRMQDAEYVIVGAVEGKGKWKNSLGAFVCSTKDGNHVFTVTPASTDAQKRQMWATWKTAYKGKALTVQFQELTADGVPRFPVGKSIRGAANGSDWI